MDDWKEDTLRMFYDLYQGKKVKDILPDYNLSQRGIYKLISRNKLREFVEYFHGVRMELEKLKEIDRDTHNNELNITQDALMNVLIKT
jgi:hypothetical protein